MSLDPARLSSRRARESARRDWTARGDRLDVKWQPARKSRNEIILSPAKNILAMQIGCFKVLRIRVFFTYVVPDWWQRCWTGFCSKTLYQILELDFCYLGLVLFFVAQTLCSMLFLSRRSCQTLLPKHFPRFRYPGFAANFRCQNLVLSFCCPNLVTNFDAKGVVLDAAPKTCMKTLLPKRCP